jgi:hypothetical protein
VSHNIICKIIGTIKQKFRKDDPGSRGYWYVFWLDFLKNPCSFIFLLIKLVPETIRSKKKVGLIFHPSFYVGTVGSGGSGSFLPPGSWMKNLGIRIRDKTSWIRNTAEDIKYLRIVGVPVP